MNSLNEATKELWDLYDRIGRRQKERVLRAIKLIESGKIEAEKAIIYAYGWRDRRLGIDDDETDSAPDDPDENEGSEGDDKQNLI